MSFTTFLSDRSAVRNRGDWFVELYPKDPNGDEQILRFSRRGTSTGASAISVGGVDTLPAHTIYRRRVIKLPTLTQSIWQPGRLLSNSIPSFGNLILTNSDGGLDQYHPNNGWTWAGCRYKTFFADKRDIPGTIGKVADGFMGQPKFDLSIVDVPLNGRESLFDVQISERVYRGTSYGLELFGDRRVSFGTPAAVNLTGNMTAEFWLWIDALPTSNRQFYGWLAGIAIPWRFDLGPTGVLSIIGHVGGVPSSAMLSTSLSTLRPYHVACIIEGRDVTFVLFDDDNSVEIINEHVNTFSAATRDSNSGGTLSYDSRSDAVFKPWLDEARVWNYARSLDDIRANRHRPLAGNVPATCVHCVGFDDGSGVNVTDSSATAAHGTISGAGTSTWLWMHEGGPELAGTPKPDVYGERFGCKPVLVDPTGVNGAVGYQVAGGGQVNDIDSFEGGAIHTSTSAASFRAYITTAPVAGLFSGNVSLQYLPRGLFKLGSTPTLPVSATVKGYDGGPLGYVNKGTQIVRDIITRRGPKLADPDDLDMSSFSLPGSEITGIMGVFIDSKKKISEILDFISQSGAGWWGYIRASTLFHIEKFSGPSVTPDFNFDKRRIISIEPMPPLQVIYKVIVRYRQNNVVLSEDQVAASVKSTLNWQDWTREWLEEPASDDTIRKAFPGSSSVPLTIDTGLQLATDARALADYVLSLVKGYKEGWLTTVVLSGGLEATIAQTSTIEVELQRNRDRLGLDGATNYAIISVEDNRQAGTVRLGQWG